MMPVSSLADHLRRNTALAPDAAALITAEQSRTWANLLAEAEACATTIGADEKAFVTHGNSAHLALHAYACSLKNRPFWPVDRNRPAILDDAAQVPADTALIISTSGSEGEAKAVLLSTANLASAALAANRRLPLTAGDCWLACLPLYHIGGQSILWRCAQAGASVLLHEGFDAQRVAGALTAYPVSHISLVPAMLARLLDQKIKPPASLRHAIIGGAALSLTLFERARAAGWPLNPSYGMSESSAQIATWTPADGEWHEGLVGQALPGNEISLSDDGRIRIRGAQIMRGYLGAPHLADGAWFTTGDLGKIDAKTRLTVTGRADDMLISGGCNVHPAEVESCLAGCPGVLDVAVTGIPDAVWGDLVAALVVGNASPAEITRWCTARLPSAALPRRIVQLRELPRNSAGKLERASLRRLASEALA